MHSSPSTAGATKPRGMKRAGHEACMDKREMHARFLRKNLKEGDYLEELGVRGRIIIKWIIKKRRWGENWNRLTQGRNKQRTAVNTMNVWTPTAVQTYVVCPPRHKQHLYEFTSYTLRAVL
jgi:hypothetical protein